MAQPLKHWLHKYEHLSWVLQHPHKCHVAMVVHLQFQPPKVRQLQSKLAEDSRFVGKLWFGFRDSASMNKKEE